MMTDTIHPALSTGSMSVNTQKSILYRTEADLCPLVKGDRKVCWIHPLQACRWSFCSELVPQRIFLSSVYRSNLGSFLNSHETETWFLIYKKKDQHPPPPPPPPFQQNWDKEKTKGGICLLPQNFCLWLKQLRWGNKQNKDWGNKQEIKAEEISKTCVSPSMHPFSMLLLLKNKLEFPQDQLRLLLAELQSSTLGRAFHLKSLICMLSDSEQLSSK